jgi:hypothetical protein
VELSYSFPDISCNGRPRRVITDKPVTDKPVQFENYPSFYRNLENQSQINREKKPEDVNM